MGRGRIYRAVVVAVVILALASPTGGVRGATRCVALGGAGGCHASLQAAVDVASAGDTITVAAGTYATNATIAIPGTAADPPLHIVGAGAGVTILDGSMSGPVIFVRFGNVPVTLSGVTVQGGIGNSFGAGVANLGNVFALSESVVRNNVASGGQGGGIYNGGTMTITGSAITGNRATSPANLNGAIGNGGGILNSGSLALVRSTVAENTTVNGSGGGIYSHGSLALTDSTVRDNRTVQDGTQRGDGGGIFNNAGTVEATRSTLSGNVTTGDGGAIYNQVGSTATVRLDTSTVSGNTASSGSAMLLEGGSNLTLRRSTITDNRSTGTERPAAVFNWGGTVAITGTIVAGNGAGIPDVRFVGGIINSGGYNLIGTVVGATFNGTGDILGASPSLGPLADNGGPTRTHLPLGNSRAVDAGGGCTDTDQRGVPRPQGAACDIGAVERPLLPAPPPRPTVPPLSGPFAPLPPPRPAAPQTGGAAPNPLPPRR